MKYNRSEIMKSAWTIKRNAYRLPFAECLRRAWSYAKYKAEECKTEIVQKFENGMTVVADGYERTLNRWTKNGMDRVYINGGTRRGDGYIDLKTRKAYLRGNYTYQRKIAEAVLAMAF